MSEHLAASDLEQFVIGNLDATRAAHVEAHVVACDTCSAMLAREAQLEMALDEVANAPVTREIPVLAPGARAVAARREQRGRVSFAIAAAATLSIAAAWLLWLAPSTHFRSPASASDQADVAANRQSAGAGGVGGAPLDAATALRDTMTARAYDQLDGGSGGS